MLGVRMGIILNTIEGSGGFDGCFASGERSGQRDAIMILNAPVAI